MGASVRKRLDLPAVEHARFDKQPVVCGHPRPHAEEPEPRQHLLAYLFRQTIGGRREEVAFAAHLGGALLGVLYYRFSWNFGRWLPESIALPKLGGGFGLGPEAAGPLLGRFLVEGLLFFLLLGVLFVAPGYAAGQIAGVFPLRIGDFRVVARKRRRQVLSVPADSDLHVAVRASLARRVQVFRAGEFLFAFELTGRLGERYEVLGWPRLLPMVAVSIRFHEVVSYVVLLVFFIVVAAAVANPVLMSVLERTREFGIVLALGMSRARLLGLVLLESMVLGIAGVVAGNALGLSITGYFAAAGMNVGAFEAGLRTMPGLSDVIFPVLLAERSFMLSALVFAIACLTALYPAAKAARLDPSRAIRHV